MNSTKRWENRTGAGGCLRASFTLWVHSGAVPGGIRAPLGILAWVKLDRCAMRVGGRGEVGEPAPLLFDRSRRPAPRTRGLDAGVAGALRHRGWCRALGVGL